MKFIRDDDLNFWRDRILNCLFQQEVFDCKLNLFTSRFEVPSGAFAAVNGVSTHVVQQEPAGHIGRKEKRKAVIEIIRFVPVLVLLKKNPVAVLALPVLHRSI